MSAHATDQNTASTPLRTRPRIFLRTPHCFHLRSSTSRLSLFSPALIPVPLLTTIPHMSSMPRAKSALITGIPVVKGDDLARTTQKAIFFRLKGRITYLMARTTASRVLGYSCAVEAKHCFHPFPSQRHDYYSVIIFF